MHVSAWWIVNKGLTQAVTVFLPPANMSQVGIWSSSVTVIISSRMPRNIFWWILPLRSLTENNYLKRWCCFVSMCSTVCFLSQETDKVKSNKKKKSVVMSAVFSKADLMFNHYFIHIHAPKRSPTCWDDKWGPRSTKQNIFTHRFFRKCSWLENSQDVMWVYENCKIFFL